MSKNPDDFVFPRGLLRPAMLGVTTPEQLTGALDRFIADGTTKAAGAADVDTAVEAYVYWRAFESAAVLRASEPATLAIEGDESETYGVHQLAFFTEQAARYAAQFTAALPVPAAQAVARSGTSVRTVVSW